METTVEKTWKPITAGILDIISGALGAPGVIGLVIAIVAGDTRKSILDSCPP